MYVCECVHVRYDENHRCMYKILIFGASVWLESIIEVDVLGDGNHSVQIDLHGFQKSCCWPRNWETGLLSSLSSECLFIITFRVQQKIYQCEWGDCLACGTKSITKGGGGGGEGERVVWQWGFIWHNPVTLKVQTAVLVILLYNPVCDSHAKGHSLTFTLCTTGYGEPG